MYNINYLFVMSQLLAPDKRSKSVIALNSPAFKELQSINSDLFETYKSFQSIVLWDSGTEYSINDRVTYQKAIYKSLKDANTGNPTDPKSWQLVSPNFFGTENRIRINSQKLVLEYALNTWFGTTFLQPPGVSDIFISNIPSTGIAPFLVGTSGINSSYTTTVSSDAFIGINASFSQSSAFAVHVPIAVFNALGDTDSIRENIIREFVNKFVLCGVNYDVLTY